MCQCNLFQLLITPAFLLWRVNCAVVCCKESRQLRKSYQMMPSVKTCIKFICIFTSNSPIYCIHYPDSFCFLVVYPFLKLTCLKLFPPKIRLSSTHHPVNLSLLPQPPQIVSRYAHNQEGTIVLCCHGQSCWQQFVVHHDDGQISRRCWSIAVHDISNNSC